MALLPQTPAVLFEQPLEHDESNLERTIPVPDAETSSADESVQSNFRVVPKASKRGGDLLVERGYTYTKDGKAKKGQQPWRCTICNASLTRLASVMQKGSSFVRGAQPHLCVAKDCALPAAQINAHLRLEGKERPHASGSTLVKEALDKFLTQSAPASSLPPVANLVRHTNRARQKRRPKHPDNLEFNWVDEALPPHFLQEDIRVGSARHILLFTSFLLGLLRSAKTWYVDATFKAVSKPFYQLFSIHAFVKQNSSVKQIPLAMVIMSRRSKQDYIEILKIIKERLVYPPLAVVMDFESAIWGAFKDVMPSVNLRGCCFHWKQAAWRKIKEFGLRSHYHKKAGGRRFLLELMSLPFLPAEQIHVTFTEFCNLLHPTHERGFHLLVEYMEATWVNSSVFPPSTWSVFGQSVRTNNDVEGWHHGLNRMIARKGNENINLNIYELVEVLHVSAMQAQSDCRLVSEDKLRKYQRKQFCNYQAKLFTLWDQYTAKELRPTQLLQRVSCLHAPLADEQHD